MVKNRYFSPPSPLLNDHFLNITHGISPHLGTIRAFTGTNLVGLRWDRLGWVGPDFLRLVSAGLGSGGLGSAELGWRQLLVSTEWARLGAAGMVWLRLAELGWVGSSWARLSWVRLGCNGLGSAGTGSGGMGLAWLCSLGLRCGRLGSARLVSAGIGKAPLQRTRKDWPIIGTAGFVRLVLADLGCCWNSLGGAGLYWVREGSTGMGLASLSLAGLGSTLRGLTNLGWAGFG